MALGSRYRLTQLVMVIVFSLVLWHSASLWNMRLELSVLSGSLNTLSDRLDIYLQSQQDKPSQEPLYFSEKEPVPEAKAEPEVHVTQLPKKSDAATSKQFECSSLTKTDATSAQKAFEYMKTHSQVNVAAESYEKANCEAIRNGLGTPFRYVTEEKTKEFDNEDERQFQIAYSIVFFKDFYQMERLLRAVYRPQHFYCIHLDLEANVSEYRALTKLVSCFPNVFAASRRIAVRWGKFSVLEADLICMKDLLDRSESWKYWINLTGQEYPLKTNAELVKILTAFNGGNALEGTVKRIPKSVWSRPYMIELQSLGVTPTKGAVHVLVTRAFCHFLLTDETSLKVLDIIRNNLTFPAPAEMFFSTINFNPQLGAPGSFIGGRETHPDTFPFINRLKNWRVWPFKYPCESRKWTHNLCIWGIKDLPFVTNVSRVELFLNKLHLNFEYLTLDCLEHWYWQRSFTQIAKGTRFDVSFYQNMKISSSHV